jgi:hypothetical protein
MTKNKQQQNKASIPATATSVGAMAFYNPQGLVPAWRSALAFAGEGGRIATLPDLVAARLATKARPGEPAWGSYFASSSAEYVGIGKSGKRILIVALGVGPLATLDGVLKAYANEYKDKERNRHGGRISREKFLKLESGFYGEVAIVDYERYVELCETGEGDGYVGHRYAFMSHLRASQLRGNPLAAARLGPQYLEFIDRLTAECHEYQKDMGPHRRDTEPHIMRLEDLSNASYKYHKIGKDEAFANLLVMGQAQPTGHSDDDRGRYDSLITEVDLHGWSHGIRLAALRAGTKPGAIHRGLANMEDLIASHEDLIFKPVSEPSHIGFRNLVKVGKAWFTQCEKVGESMDTVAPEFAVTSIEKVPGPSTFTTKGYGSPFLKYGIKEVESIAPIGANAFDVGDIAVSGDDHIVSVRFYRVTVDNTRRLRRMDEVYNDVELLLKLVA